MPGRVRVRPGLPEPAHLLGVGRPSSARSRTNLAVLVQYNHAKGVHITRFLNGNDAALGDGSPWVGHRPRTGAAQRHRRPDRGGLQRQEQVRRPHLRPHQALVAQLPVPGRTTRCPGTTPTTTTSAIPSPSATRASRDLDAEYGFSDRDQRHRFNGFLLWQAPGAVNVNVRYSYRSAQPHLAARRTARRRRRRSWPALRPHPARRQRRAAQHRPQGQHLLRRSTSASRASSRSAGGERWSRSSRSSTSLNSTNLLVPADHEPDLQLRRHGPAPAWATRARLQLGRAGDLVARHGGAGIATGRRGPADVPGAGRGCAQRSRAMSKVPKTSMKGKRPAQFLSSPVPPPWCGASGGSAGLAST